MACQELEGRDVPATGLGVANDYSVFLMHDMNAYNSDVEGRVAVGGNANITAYSVGLHLANSNGTADSLIVGGSLTFTNGQVNNGNIVYGGNGTFDSFGHPDGSIRQQSNVIDFGAAYTNLQNLSNSYAALPQTGTVRNVYGTIVLTGNNPGQNVFNIPASLLWNANDLVINTPAGSSAIVNVSGPSIRMQYMGFHLNGVSKDNVILNMPDAVLVNFAGIGIFGNVLAPQAYVDFSNGQLNGTLVACAFTGYGQINLPQQASVCDPGMMSATSSIAITSAVVVPPPTVTNQVATPPVQQNVSHQASGKPAKVKPGNVTNASKVQNQAHNLTAKTNWNTSHRVTRSFLSSLSY